LRFPGGPKHAKRDGCFDRRERIRGGTTTVLQHARISNTLHGKAADFIGVDEAAFPRDFGVFVRYHYDFLRKIADRYPTPPALTLAEVDEFLSRTRNRYRVTWLG